MRTLRLSLRFYGATVKSMLEYRLTTLIDILIMIINFSVGYLSTWVLLSKFQSIQGWTLYEVFLLFNINMVASGISGLFFSEPMRAMEQMVQKGEFDMVLIRPMNSLVFTLIGRPNFSSVASLILGAGVFVLCFTHLAVHITVLKIVFLLVAILGAALIQSSILVIIGTISFWVVKNTATYSLLTCFNNFIDYPITIYNKLIQVFLTFVIPFAFVNFYPAHYFLDKTGDNLFFPAIQYGTPVVGLLLFFLAYRFWKIGVNKYESTGS